MIQMVEVTEGCPPVQELWAELSASMRALRVNGGVSLRQAELTSGRRRGTLSQVENGKARPGRELVDWYDETFGGDGLLLSLYAEARGARGASRRRVDGSRPQPGDALEVADPAFGEGDLVACGAEIEAAWTLSNVGAVAWAERRLERVGAHTAARLIASAPWVPVPDCAPGQRVRVEVAVTMPAVPGTFAAHWVVVDRDGRSCYEPPARLRLLLTCRDAAG